MGDAGKGCRKKRMSACNGSDRVCNIIPPERGLTSGWSFIARKLIEPSKEEKQMTTANITVGAASYQDIEWHSINWDKAHKLVRRLQVRIAKAHVKDAGTRRKPYNGS